MPKKTRSISTNTKAAPTFAGIQRGTPTAEFAPDYSQTKSDLKRIGILAGSFFAILIALSFFIK
jgi:hypothetical protein